MTRKDEAMQMLDEMETLLKRTEDTLRRKLRRPEDFKVGELIAADKAVRWTAFAKEAK